MISMRVLKFYDYSSKYEFLNFRSVWELQIIVVEEDGVFERYCVNRLSIIVEYCEKIVEFYFENLIIFSDQKCI